ncbi:gluconate 2-dehydrogenase subunit 3 family protein [Mycobacterium kansasii 732]|nr:gluconate 2-dehydrogenase subunit 3 family protein [Mycobacterium kansasii 732]
MIGRYPDYDVLSTVDSWDAATRAGGVGPAGQAGPLRFFEAPQEPALRAFCDTVLAQDAEPRIPVAEFVDAKLADGRLDGYQYDDMPDDRDTWRLVLSGLDESARAAARSRSRRPTWRPANRWCSSSPTASCPAACGRK